jgi:hypothetical protein
MFCKIGEKYLKQYTYIKKSMWKFILFYFISFLHKAHPKTTFIL